MTKTRRQRSPRMHWVGLDVSKKTFDAALAGPDLRRFERARQLTAYAGVSPRVVQSGTSVREKTRMCKRGNDRVRQALYLSAKASLNTKEPNSLSTMHYRLCDGGKEGKAALGAVMRKQLTVMRAVIISGKPYERTFKRNGKLNGQRALRKENFS